MEKKPYQVYLQEHQALELEESANKLGLKFAEFIRQATLEKIRKIRLKINSVEYFQ